MKTYTIKDIAKLAKVSRGTVDRVIHERGKVSDEARKKVKIVLEQIEYEPNLLAKSLKNQKGWTITAMIPDSALDEYWKQVIDGIKEFEEEYRGFGLEVSVVSFASDNPDSFVSATTSLLDNPPNAVLIAPLFLHESIEFLEQLQKLDIPFITINNEIQDVPSLSFIGQDLIRSGRTAANLIEQCTPSLTDVLILNLSEDPHNASHISHKSQGLRAYFNETNIDIKEITLGNIDVELEPKLRQMFSDKSNTVGVFITTSKAHLVAPQIKKWSPGSAIVGFDLIPQNIELLENKTINFLINQNPSRMAFEGLQKFADNFVYGKKVTDHHYLPIDIVTSENIKSYTN